MELIFATANPGKVREAQQICDSLGREFGIDLVIKPMPEKVDIVEDGSTYAENSLIKARYVWEHYHAPCIADDSGLEVQALGGGPGIYTARYCSHDFASGIDKLLHELRERGAMEISQRRARFVCDITLILGDEVKQFEGICEGAIGFSPRGECGFGYDPVFMPDAFPGKCTAELPDGTKNLFSHRGKAMRKMFEYLSAEMKSDGAL